MEPELLEFLLVFIEIQIKKYLKLTKIGIGPDAKMNAALVYHQVQDLFIIADKLMTLLEKKEGEDVKQYAEQISFYLECEHLRGLAAWLIDENKIHNPEYGRLLEQRQNLARIMKQNQPPKIPSPTTDQQSQCLYDSYSIAHYILNIAFKLKKNPEHQLEDEEGLGHGINIMRKHAKKGGRYHKIEIWRQIEELHKQCDLFVKEKEDFTKSTETLDHSCATELATIDGDRWQALCSRFKEVAPNSDLAKGASVLYEIGKLDLKSAPTIPQKDTASNSCWPSTKTLVKFGFLATTTIMVGVSVAKTLDDTALQQIASVVGLGL